MAGTIVLDAITDGTGNTVSGSTVVNGSAKAWVNFNGTGTVAIRSSFNVSSITDNGTGDYTVNFTTAMPNIDYVITGAQGDTGTPNGAGMFATNRVGSTGVENNPTTTACRVNTTNSSGNVRDNTYVYVAIFSS